MSRIPRHAPRVQLLDADEGRKRLAGYRPVKDGEIGTGLILRGGVEALPVPIVAVPELILHEDHRVDFFSIQGATRDDSWWCVELRLCDGPQERAVLRFRLSGRQAWWPALASFVGFGLAVPGEGATPAHTVPPETLAGTGWHEMSQLFLVNAWMQEAMGR